MDDELLELLESAASEGVVTLACGCTVEPDAPHCGECGTPNPLRTNGLI